MIYPSQHLSEGGGAGPTSTPKESKVQEETFKMEEE